MGERSRKPKSHLLFEQQPMIPGKKTKVYYIRSAHNGSLLGEIKWYAPWRKYCLFTLGIDSVWDVNCLNEITAFITKLMEERKK